MVKKASLIRVIDIQDIKRGYNHQSFQHIPTSSGGVLSKKGPALINITAIRDPMAYTIHHM